MDIKEFLRKTTTLKRFIDGVVLQMPRPHIVCQDGFRFSVQAGRGLYSNPRDIRIDGNYKSVEVGYPSKDEVLLEPFREYGGAQKIYGYVPVELVDRVLKKHGGIDVEKTFGGK